MEKKVIYNEPSDDSGEDINALANNKVAVDIDPNVKSNNVNIQMCSCSIVFNCFSPNKPDTT
jgi:hypothetical protein